MSGCTHTIPNSRWEDIEVTGYDGETTIETVWVDEEIITIIDIDIHHYKCTQCNKIMRY